ncbi:hypothetical protein BASA83_004476 [Batrachochytrium salamandrivorans]|nr:hypothetical protein BASA83_004476 [Batrachochytrium salamandrivorans]
MKIACVCQHCGHQIVHRKKSERAVFAFAEMQSFSKRNDVIRPNQSTGLVQNAKANKRKTTGARSSAGTSQSSSQTGSILQYTLPKLMKKGVGQD